MHDGIAWPVVQRMMIDAPSYEYGDDKKEEMALTEENEGQFINFINDML